MIKQPTWNHQVVKKKNKEMVLNEVNAFSPLSRADIAQRLGLNKATVSSLINELIEEELIYESGPGESSGGRRPVMLLFNEKAGYSIGIDIGVNYLLGVVTDLAGSAVVEKTIKIKNLSVDELISLVKNTIHELLKLAPQSKYGVIGIGIGVPGVVDKSGKVLIAPNLKWVNVDLKRILSHEFNAPIFIENEANAGAYGEKRFGAGKDSSSMIYVSLGIGIGTGMVLNGELYRGFNGYSGESGHMTIVANGETCTCGNNGCWEAYASEYALLRGAEQHEALTGTTLEELIQLANNGDSLALELFSKIASYIGIGITNLIKAFNPEQVIIGNRLAQAQKLIENPIKEAVNTQTLPFYQTDLLVSFSKLSTYSAAIGISAFAIDDFLKISQID